MGERSEYRQRAVRSKNNIKRMECRRRQRGEQEPEVSVARFCMSERREEEEERARAERGKSRREDENNSELFSKGSERYHSHVRFPLCWALTSGSRTRL